MNGQLGCGSYEAHILTRGGRDFVDVIPWNQLNWGRVLDDTSQANATADVGCCGVLAQARSWRNELQILRDGLEVWVGPILSPSSPLQGSTTQFKADAADITAWWDHRFIHLDHDWIEPTDLAVIFEALAYDAMAPDSSPGMLLNATLCGIKSVFKVLTVQHRIAGPTLRDLAKIGVDWTAIGRRVLAGGVVIPTDPIGTFTDDHFVQPPVVVESGADKANRWVVAGSGGGAAGDAIYGVAGDGASQHDNGLLESVASVSTVQDYDGAVAAARTRVALTKEVLSVQSAILDASAPFPIDTLIPGAACELALSETCIPVSGPHRLQSVSVSAGADGTEQVTVVFQPEGTIDE